LIKVSNNQDSEGEAPIHICAREGLLGLAQTLCAFGCNVDLPNEDGMLPLHLGKASLMTSYAGSRVTSLADCLVTSLASWLMLLPDGSRLELI
jgi:hypothetical protein